MQKKLTAQSRWLFWKNLHLRYSTSFIIYRKTGDSLKFAKVFAQSRQLKKQTIYFMSLIPSYNQWKHHNTRGFPMFIGGYRKKVAWIGLIYQLIKRQSRHHIEASQLICRAKHLTGFYINPLSVRFFCC